MAKLISTKNEKTGQSKDGWTVRKETKTYSDGTYNSTTYHGSWISGRQVTGTEKGTHSKK